MSGWLRMGEIDGATWFLGFDDVDDEPVIAKESELSSGVSWTIYGGGATRRLSLAKRLARKLMREGEYD